MIPSPYAGAIASLATRHDKWSLVAPSMREILGVDVRSMDVDTDALGTFTGEIERAGTMFEVAVTKARLGMAASGCSIGLASEGSISPASDLPWLIRDLELVVFVDDEKSLAIGELASSFDIVTVSEVVSPVDDLRNLTTRADFPRHALIVRPSVRDDDFVMKGIRRWDELNRSIAAAAARSADGRAHVETDLRAHMCPSRRPTIAEAARKLARRMACTCPRCECPGWGTIRFEAGATCSDCGAETSVIRHEVQGCSSCTHEERTEIRAAVDPSRCAWCNP